MDKDSLNYRKKALNWRLVRCSIKLRIERFVFLKNVVDDSQQLSGDRDNCFLRKKPRYLEQLKRD